jgi:UDPglucose--hexose-1-phosphate uridylyltransferase
VFELRRDPITGWWSAVVTDRTFEHASFAVAAAPVEGSHCRHCDEDPSPATQIDPNDATVRRVILRSDAFHRIDSTKESASQLSMSEVSSSEGSWEIIVAPRNHHERLAVAAPRLAMNLLRSLRDTMRELGADANPPDEPLCIQAVQSYGRQAGSRSQHLNIELYAIPQVPHRLAEEIGGGARHQIKYGGCVWCGLARAEEESGERLVLAEERFVVFAPAASRSAFELMIVPRAHAADFTTLDDDDLAATAATLQRTLRAFDVLGDPPYNLFLHTAPARERLDASFHWHWELHPRLRVIAGLERATALAVNPAAPEYAAEVLREHLHRSGPVAAGAGSTASL